MGLIESKTSDMFSEEKKKKTKSKWKIEVPLELDGLGKRSGKIVSKKQWPEVGSCVKRLGVVSREKEKKPSGTWIYQLGSDTI